MTLRHCCLLRVVALPLIIVPRLPLSVFCQTDFLWLSSLSKVTTFSCISATSCAVKYLAERESLSTMPVKPATISNGREITPLKKPDTMPLLASEPIVLASTMVFSIRVRYCGIYSLDSSISARYFVE